MAAAEKRWKNWNEAPARLAGDALLHTDWNPGNVLISEGKAYIIDWAWATRGASWIDAASWVVHLIAAGHTLAEAENWASRIPAWKHATTADLTAWATTQARVWNNAVHSGAPKWVLQAARSAQVWKQYREERP
jgi:thiamine kinase-like enzyme